MDTKKAFEQMKKELKKETGIHGGFAMTARQIKNRTATYCFGLTFPFEWEIDRLKAEDEKVQGFETWTAEMKEKRHNETLGWIDQLEARRKKYGTKENELRDVAARIVNSKAFQKFQDQIGKVDYLFETRENCYYIRFNY